MFSNSAPIISWQVGRHRLVNRRCCWKKKKRNSRPPLRTREAAQLAYHLGALFLFPLQRDYYLAPPTATGSWAQGKTHFWTVDGTPDGGPVVQPELVIISLTSPPLAGQSLGLSFKQFVLLFFYFQTISLNISKFTAFFFSILLNSGNFRMNEIGNN